MPAKTKGELALQVESLRSKDLLDAMPEGVYITDLDRRIVFWNKAAERITGWSREQVVGKRCADNILAHTDKDGHQLCSQNTCPLARAMVTGQTSQEPILVYARTESGEKIPVEVSVAPLVGGLGKVIGGIETFRDMSPAMRDMDRARKIQKQSIKFPPIQDQRFQIASLCIPHDLVGGDFIHVEPVDENRYSIFLADVTGHGVAAALYAMQLRSLCEDHRDAIASPALFLGALNARLYTLANENDYFATATHFVVNAATGVTTYASAGQESPFHIRPDGAVSFLELKDPCLGLFQDTVYHEYTSDLEPGECFLLYTDGAIEIDDAKGKQLGVPGLLSIVSRENFNAPTQALERVEEALLNYCREIRLPDDMTMLCLRRSLLEEITPEVVSAKDRRSRADSI